MLWHAVQMLQALSCLAKQLRLMTRQQASQRTHPMMRRLKMLNSQVHGANN
jgi:hypothetical protein